MHYTNSQMKLDQLIGYFNTKKINLIPPFQRGRVWSLTMRRRLLENIVAGRPIPAIFLYKEPDGSQFAYNILDGKQRLESLILFIGTNRGDMKVDRLGEYFFSKRDREQANFSIALNGKKKTFKALDDEVIRRLREYAIPTIEIDLDDQSSLDEIINLFVDINQYGAKVKRFDIVKAIGKDNKLLKSVFDLVAQAQIRGQDRFLKRKNNIYTRVLGSLATVERATDRNHQVDRMWERLVEVVLFARTGKHRQQGQVLGTFIKADPSIDMEKLRPDEIAQLRKVFWFLDKSYSETALGKSRLARDLPHFYTMVTSLLASDLLQSDGAPPDYPGVRDKLLAFSKLLPDGAKLPRGKPIKAALEPYKEAAERQTTHPGRRDTRQEKFVEIMRVL